MFLFFSLSDIFYLYRRVFKQMLADAIDELLAERNPFDGHAELQELVWTDISMVVY